ncbi:hypothetical protein [Ideonella oryzae]|uniref:Uncharacterized protein n=1 Tax=Ideonella oryzae TaxID=2937441 RepID=A0ABT1BNM8_9BURK|nr:hypothetical protein [Ideonella oryzae]MCO5977429.1 hypothetical protein [Ideonella oryzae]
MKHWVLHLDLASPEAWPCFQRLPELLVGQHGWVEICPAGEPDQALAPLWRHALACGEPGALPNRWLAEQVLCAVWQDAPAAGRAALPAVERLAQVLTPTRDPDSPAVRQEWAALCERSRQLGVGRAPLLHRPADGARWVGEAAISQAGRAQAPAQGL